MKYKKNKNCKVLAIIPARGGSKSIHKKNIRKLYQKPLIEYSIICAQKSKYVNRIIVSTDDRKIANISENAGAEVPFLRPKKLSTDNSKTLDVTKQVLEFLDAKESYKPDIITHLQPTTPFRTSAMLDKSIQMLQNSNATSVLGVKKIKTHPYRHFCINQIAYHLRLIRGYKTKFNLMILLIFFKLTHEKYMKHIQMWIQLYVIGGMLR